MPFAIDKQRRYLWSQKPEVAKQIAYKEDGGLLSGLQKPEIKNLEDLERVANARNQELAAVAAELGINPQDLAAVQGSSADQANAIAAQIWGENAPQLRESSGAAESASEMAGVLAELAKQNPGAWGDKAKAAAPNNALQPAKQQGFWDWAVDQAGEAAGAASTAFQDTYDSVTGQTASQQEADRISNMSAEELVEHLNSKYPQQGQVPTTATPPAPAERSWTQKGLDALGRVGDAINPVSDANASSREFANAAALATVPNPFMSMPVAQAGVGPSMGSTGVAADNQAGFHWGRATDDDARQTWKQGWFKDGFETETPEDIAKRQVEGMQGFEQTTGFAMPAEQETFLHDQFEREATNPTQFQEEDRDYWGGGWSEMGSGNTERNVVTDSGHMANAATAQGDWEIQSLLNNPDQGLSDSYDDGDDDGWDDYASSYDDVDDWSYDGGWDEPAPMEDPYEESGGGDDSGGGGGGK